MYVRVEKEGVKGGRRVRWISPWPGMDVIEGKGDDDGDGDGITASSRLPMAS